jgi:hypothetical protein
MAHDSWPKPPKTEVLLTRSEARISDVPPGQERIELLRQLSERFRIEAADVDRPLREVVDDLAALECVAIAEAIWKVELGPRSGTVSEIGDMMGAFPTLRALIAAAEEAARAS